MHSSNMVQADKEVNLSDVFFFALKGQSRDILIPFVGLCGLACVWLWAGADFEFVFRGYLILGRYDIFLRN